MEYTELEKRNLLKKQVEKLKPLLPRSWKARLIKKYPEHNNVKDMVFIQNVLNLRAYSESITEKIRVIVVEWIDEQKEMIQTTLDL
jgi:hypothetical protein